jgi:hypothetical protein
MALLWKDNEISPNIIFDILNPILSETFIYTCIHFIYEDSTHSTIFGSYYMK